MLNKLIYGYRLILTPYLKILENSSGDAATVTETNLLLHFVSHTDMLTTYSEELFENYADHIEVMSRNEIRFVMKCGLTFTERIGD